MRKLIVMMLGLGILLITGCRPGEPKSATDEQLKSAGVGSAQQATYLDERYKPTTTGAYAYKRVIKFKSPELNPNIGIGYYGNITSHVTQTGLYYCSLTDYYNTGEPALIATIVSMSTACKDWIFDGQVISYYRDGHVRQKMLYKSGKPEGELITLNEDGSVKNTDYYENGKLIDKRQFAVSPHHVLLGRWKSNIYGTPTMKGVRPWINQTIIAVFSQDGILEISSVRLLGGSPIPSSAESEKFNWKYISRTPSGGILEQYAGGNLIMRGDVTWIDRNQFEYVNTFHPDSNAVGTHYRYVRQ